MADIKLDTPVQYVKGVGPTRAIQLSELGVRTVGDLLVYYPRRFDLRKQVQPIDSLLGNEDSATVAGEVFSTHEKKYGKLPYFECCIRDATGWVGLKWFHGGYLRDKIKEGMQLAVSGKVGVYEEAFQLVNPRFQIIWDPAGTDLSQDELLPVYPAGAKLSSGVIGQIVKKVLPLAETLVREWFDERHLNSRELMPRPQAVAAMHRPEDKDHWRAARRRLAYDECFLMQLGIAINRMKQVSRPAHALPGSAEIDRRIRARFPFKLTEAQDRAIAQISADIARPKPMNRLLQGDVGSGKTVVALYACLVAVANRRQAAIMAPTEILASQHFDRINQYLAGSKVRVELLVGGQNQARRQEILDRLAGGEIDIIVGTHALLGENVRFGELALVVVDEQHKFGVRQRSGIRGKGFAPHYLVMTATPIPRTLAMTVFGDLDVSVIDASPPGRGSTTTRVASQADLPVILDAVREAVAQGQQAYFIYPLVNPSPDLELKAAQEAYRELSGGGPLAGVPMGLIHGQMPQQKKEQAMQDFRSGKTKLLVSSVVVEVGLDVPAANVIVIMHAERFGLAQLHQLRGRVGRAGQNAMCVLIASPGSEDARRRLAVLEATTDGFKIAEEDMRIRGPGELFGTAQHGLPELKVADLLEDFDLLRMARKDAFEIVAADPGLNAPHNQQIRRELIAVYSGRLDLLEGA